MSRPAYDGKCNVAEIGAVNMGEIGAVARVKSALRAGYWPTCRTEGHMVVNDHTRSAENWKCVWYLLRLYIYRVYVDSHSLGQLALASKRIS